MPFPVEFEEGNVAVTKDAQKSRLSLQKIEQPNLLNVASKKAPTLNFSMNLLGLTKSHPTAEPSGPNINLGNLKSAENPQKKKKTVRKPFQIEVCDLQNNDYGLGKVEVGNLSEDESPPKKTNANNSIEFRISNKQGKVTATVSADSSAVL